MSEEPEGEGEEQLRLRQVLECEECRFTVDPQIVGLRSVHEVPHHVRCPRCGADFCIVDIWPDDEEDG